MKKQINLSQRYQIACLLKAGISKNDIANNIGFSIRTIYKEVNRNSKTTNKGRFYDPEFAQILCEMRHKMKQKKVRLTARIKRRIRFLTKCDWSPEQIVQRCKLRKLAMVSIETIYLYLYELKRKGTDLCIHLRRHHRKRRKRKSKNHCRQIIKNKVHISKRPKAADNASRTGHTEIDLMKCTNGYLLTLTDRKSLYNFILKLPNKSSKAVKAALTKLKNIASHLKTITSDNGTEFSLHEQLAKLLNVKWYFADPYCSQQRGCNENQNGLIRQYFKRDTDLNKVTEDQIAKVQKKLNYRPRKKLGFKRPIDVFKLN